MTGLEEAPWCEACLSAGISGVMEIEKVRSVIVEIESVSSLYHRRPRNLASDESAPFARVMAAREKTLRNTELNSQTGYSV
jgi:hypothetical protein